MKGIFFLFYPMRLSPIIVLDVDYLKQAEHFPWYNNISYSLNGFQFSFFLLRELFGHIFYHFNAFVFRNLINH